jgi:creatinine amidohydrolase
MRINALVVVLVLSTSAFAQTLPARWDELTASEWPKALEQSANTCILPIGILEKHGRTVTWIGSDTRSRMGARYQNHMPSFSRLLCSQIYEARHQQALLHCSRLVWDVDNLRDCPWLQAIVIINGTAAILN